MLMFFDVLSININSGKVLQNNIRNKLNAIKMICAHHKALCQSFMQWKVAIEENDAQLKILNEEVMSLRERHQKITAQLSKEPVDAETIIRLEDEVRKIGLQVNMWIRELTEISKARTKLEVQFICLRSNIRLNTVNIEMANMDIDRIELNYRQIWNDFLYNNNSNNSECVSNDNNSN
ncbi:hypothetical protein X798_06433 [Onchocerca flexuosa]|uniref:Uncharacterized protein n=1 Tax=Onchocerca flexuosa TaxID=387005 RepID=A0A238BMB5_9BILA|nr:hypothetical protein X798_06433 [Onchocerca flexuosa]